MHDDGLRPIAICHMSDSGDLIKQCHSQTYICLQSK